MYLECLQGLALVPRPELVPVFQVEPESRNLAIGTHKCCNSPWCNRDQAGNAECSMPRRQKKQVGGGEPSLAEILLDESAVSWGQDIWGGNNISQTRRVMESFSMIAQVNSFVLC